MAYRDTSEYYSNMPKKYPSRGLDTHPRFAPTNERHQNAYNGPINNQHYPKNNYWANNNHSHNANHSHHPLPYGPYNSNNNNNAHANNNNNYNYSKHGPYQGYASAPVRGPPLPHGNPFPPHKYRAPAAIPKTYSKGMRHEPYSVSQHFDTKTERYYAHNSGFNPRGQRIQYYSSRRGVGRGRGDEVQHDPLEDLDDSYEAPTTSPHHSGRDTQHYGVSVQQLEGTELPRSGSPSQSPRRSQSPPLSQSPDFSPSPSPSRSLRSRSASPSRSPSPSHSRAHSQRHPPRGRATTRRAANVGSQSPSPNPIEGSIGRFFKLAKESENSRNELHGALEYFEQFLTSFRPTANGSRLDHNVMFPHKLVVLDIDGVCIDKLFRNSIHDTTLFDRAYQSIEVGGYVAYLRPGIREWLKDMFHLCSVAFWSSSFPQNVKLICDFLLEEIPNCSPWFVWDRTHCRLDPGYGTDRMIKKWDTVKLLDDIITNPIVNADRIWKHGDVLFIEDSHLKMRFNPVNSYIIVPRFESSDPNFRPEDWVHTLNQRPIWRGFFEEKN